MDNKPVGGRGKKAPYSTVIIRVPEPIASKVETLIDTYRDMSLNGLVTQDDLLKFDSFGIGYSNVPKITAIQEAKKILKQKKSARQSVLKLLQVLFDDSITEKDIQE